MGKLVGSPKLARDRKRPATGSYYIYWTDGERGSCEQSLRTTDIRDAQVKFELWLRENRGEHVPRSIVDVTIDEVLEHYAAIQRPKVNAPERIDYASSALLGYWHGKPVATVNRLSCLQYEEHRNRAHGRRWPDRNPISQNTIRRELAVLAAALNVASDDRLIDQRMTVFRPEEVRSDVEYFTCAEAIALLRLAWRVRRARRHLRLFLIIGFLTGRRKEAILSLRWEDIDFSTGVITWNPGGRRITKKARPPGAMPKRLRKHLLMQRKRCPTDEYVISHRGKGISDIKTAFAALVRVYRTEQRQHLIAAGMSESVAARVEVLPQAHPHMMRHSCATWLMQKGIAVTDACSYLGMSEETLRRRYWHHHPDFQRGPADAF